jgi:PAS domain S-box-containing protein
MQINISAMANNPKTNEKLLNELKKLKLENEILKSRYEAIKRKLDLSQGSLVEENLQKERLLLRTVIDNIPDSIYCKDTAGLKTLANFMELHFAGAASEAEILGKSDFDLYPKEIAEGFFADDQYVIQTGQPVLNREEYFIDKEGQKQWLLTSKLPLKDKEGNTTGIVGIGRNITSRKLVESALRESEVKLNVILQSTADGILAVDGKSKVIKTNERFSQLWNIPQSLIDLGADKALLDFVLEQLIDPEEFMSKVKKLYNSKEEDLDLLHFKDGRIFERYSAPLIMNDSSIGRVWSFRDITDRKLAEEELRNQQLLLRTVIDNIPDSIYCKDTSGRKTLANVMELFFAGAASEAEILGKTDFDFYPKEIAEGFFADDQYVIQSGQPVLNREEYFLDKEGKKQWLLTSKLPLKDKKGNIIGIVGIGHNITGRKQAEEEIKKRNEELLKLNVEKDKFFSIIAHDLKSPFLGLLGLTEILATGEEDFTKEELQQYGKGMFNTASTVYRLLENLLEWARMQKGSVSFTPNEFNISTCIIQNIEVLKQRAVQKGIILINEVSLTEIVYADEKMVDTILRNLLSNAVKFTRRGREVIVTTNKIDGEMVEVSVSDTGVGMSENDIKRLFKIEEKVGSKGTEGEDSTGLGLLLCKEFVEKNGGKIWVESEEGKGSTFRFTLPKTRNIRMDRF